MQTEKKFNSIYVIMWFRSTHTYLLKLNHFFQFCLLSCVWKQKMGVSSHRECKFTFLPSFPRPLILNGLDETHTNWRGPPALLHSLMKMLISSRNTFTDTTGIMFYPLSGHLLAQLNWHIKSNYHNPDYSVLRLL